MAVTRRATLLGWPLGLAVAALGLLLALFSYTGERAYHLGWFYVAVVGFGLVAGGIAYVGYERAIRPEIERRRARGLPPPPPFRERVRALAEGSEPRAATERPAEAPKGKVERIRMSCPSCRHAFAAEGVRPLSVHCPGCGLEGELP